MSHFPRKLVRFIEDNQELLDVQKSVSGEQGVVGTDYSGPTESPMTAQMEPTYRTPNDRVSGNEMFRRYADGTLDIEYASNKVITAIHNTSVGIVLTGIEQTALSCLFPQNFSYVDAGVSAATRAVNLKISPLESLQIQARVSKHLTHELEYMLSSHAR